MVNYNYYIWVEIEANKQRIIDEEYFKSIIKKCREAGIGSIILSAKDTTGFCIYKSSFVPHYNRFDKDFEYTDYLKTCIDAAHAEGLKLYAGIDVFAEGRVKQRHRLSPGFINTGWQTGMYGINENGKPEIQPIAELNNIRTAGSIDDFSEVFVNPVMEEVRNYELSIIKELVTNYDIDGVVLDRVRFVGLGSDFSNYTKGRFEEFIGKKVPNWPEDIYQLEAPQETEKDRNLKVVYGPLFGQWVTFRAGIIKTFIKQVRTMIKESGKNVQFADYTGSWYPLYYLVGANWASEKYVPEEYPWVDKSYADTGYAEYIDTLLSGFYYTDVTVRDALDKGRPDYWYSVEGSGDMVRKVVGDAVPYVGSLFLQQYENESETFGKAVDMCFEKSGGCMLFDLCYVDGYDWWAQCKR